MRQDSTGKTPSSALLCKWSVLEEKYVIPGQALLIKVWQNYTSIFNIQEEVESIINKCISIWKDFRSYHLLLKEKIFNILFWLTAGNFFQNRKTPDWLAAQYCPEMALWMRKLETMLESRAMENWEKK